MASPPQYPQHPHVSTEALEQFPAGRVWSGPVPKIYGPEFAADPGAVYERLRRSQGRIGRVQIADGIQAWLVLDYGLILHIERNPRLWTPATDLWSGWASGVVRENAEVMAMLGQRPNLLFASGPEHERLGRPVRQALDTLTSSPAAEKAARADVRWFAQQFVRGFSGAGRADIVAQFARPLPTLVMGRWFGLARPDELAALMPLIWDGTPSAPRALARLEALLTEEINRRSTQHLLRERMGNDLISHLVAHHARLTPEELLQTLVVTIGAGCEPTSNLISAATALWTTELRGEGVSAMQVLLRTLWEHAPVAHYPARVAVQPAEVSGRHIAAGDLVLLGLAPAGQAMVRTWPDNASRDNRAAIAFGAGPHRCPASDLSLLVAEEALHALRLLPGVALDQQTNGGPGLQWRPSPFARALSSFPVTFTPTPGVSVSASPSASDRGALCPVSSNSLTTQISTAPPRPGSGTRAPSWRSKLQEFLRGR